MLGEAADDHVHQQRLQAAPAAVDAAVGDTGAGGDLGHREGAVAAGTTAGWPPPRGSPARRAPPWRVATASAPATGSCAPRTTTAVPSSSCTATAPAHASATPTTPPCTASARPPPCSPRRRTGRDPYDGTTLPGYLYRSDDSGAPRPTVVMFNGFDGTAEEMHFFGAAAAVERGCTVLTFDGPGQPGTRHRQGLMFRPDWENVVTPVLDYAETLPGVDPERIAVLGASMGGCLAPRAAVFDRRIAAVIALDGVYDLGDISTASIPLPRQEAERRLRAPHDLGIDAALEAAMASDPSTKWALEHGMFAMGVDTPRVFPAAYLDYHLRDGIAERIACPVLVCSGEEDGFFKGQPEKLYDHLTCEKTFMAFKEREGAEAYCQSGAQRLAFARIYDWLARVVVERPAAVGRIGRALAMTGSVVEAIGGDVWSAPTPCPEWDARTTLNHVVGGMRIFAAELTGTDPGGEHHDDWLGTDPVHAYKAAAEADRAAWQQAAPTDADLAKAMVRLGFGPVPGPMAALIHLTEVLVHGVDLATVADRTHRLCEDLLTHMRRTGMDAFRRPGMFGPENPAPEGAAAHVRLLAFLGRQV
ncbi:TIGR03086 family metal-binding protein [Streptomyces sp. NPDC002573]|uniref:TIGR03086 family metal-binding protein n=1 Tax=Streptomyces sp. NPDC002573 TaxID=3364651 RepID=UPI0036745C94